MTSSTSATPVPTRTLGTHQGGLTVSADAGGLVAAEGDWYAAYVADHRDLSSAPA